MANGNGLQSWRLTFEVKHLFGKLVVLYARILWKLDWLYALSAYVWVRVRIRAIRSTETTIIHHVFVPKQLNYSILSLHFLSAKLLLRHCVSMWNALTHTEIEWMSTSACVCMCLCLWIETFSCSISAFHCDNLSHTVCSETLWPK